MCLQWWFFLEILFAKKKIFLISSFQPHLLFFCVYKSDINIIFCGFLLFETLQNHIPKNYSEHPKESWIQGTLTSIKCGLHDKRNYKFAKIGSFEDIFFFLGLKKPLLDVWISLQRTCFVSNGQKRWCTTVLAIVWKQIHNNSCLRQHEKCGNWKSHHVRTRKFKKHCKFKMEKKVSPIWGYKAAAAAKHSKSNL